MATLIRDLIELPEQVHRGDFVLRLTEGVERPDATVSTYVVTPQLAQSFDNALAFIRSALEPPTSKAVYLHGSFGSGKSHFMAVLHLLLDGDPRARAIPELASVVAKHNVWTEGRRFLLVPYHLIGAKSLESAILGHYADHIRTLHLDAPLPGVFLAERIFADAQVMRERLGDEAFFAALNSGNESTGGWGAISATWDASRFERALAAPARSEDRAQLVGDLVDRFFNAYRAVAQTGDESFIALDTGLSVISKHARSLGYDALILFLDELILWLASHAADFSFVSREGQKLAKLVEAQTADRPAPIVSFVARQRDLRDLVGDHVSGAQQLAFGDVLKWWDARFHTITLEDRNLPAIAEKRVLKPRSAAARQELDEAFRQTVQVREEVMNTLLTSTATREMFRQVYPFSPALVQALVAVSSLLQRERTALKVMLQLLVNQRDVLKVGDVVPVGDLFDAIAEGDEAFSEGMRVHFDDAKRLYHRKLLPMLERECELTAEEIRALPFTDPRATRFRTDDRLIKTLLLSALVPQVEVLKALTPQRLAALNHGTIRTPVPGREGQEVLRRLRNWAGQVGEIKLSEDHVNPTVTVQLTGVDTEGIIDQARNIDNPGNRQRKVREILFAELGIGEAEELFPVHEFTWRGTDRTCEVLYANVRELPDESFRPRDETVWRVVIDYPFDVAGHTPRSDLARIQQFLDTNEGCRTLVWLPSFLSRDSLKDLGTLVILDHILTGERFGGVSAHLAPVERAQAQSLLQNQQSQLRQKLRNILEGAYGIAAALPGSVDVSHDLAEHFTSLDGWKPQPPIGANLDEAFVHLLGQALEQQFPAHPRFETPLKTGALRKVWDVVREAAQTPDGRVPVTERPARPLVRAIAGPLGLGEMGETHFVLRDTWKQRFMQQHAAEGSGVLTVGALRRWTDLPEPRGLPAPLQNLLILTFALQTGRSPFLHGGPFEVTLDTLPDEIELRQQALPPANEWDRAVKHASSIFGYAESPLLNAANVNRLAEEIKKRASQARPACGSLAPALLAAFRSFGVNAEAAARSRTAASALRLVETLADAATDRVVSLFAAAATETSDVAVGASIAKAAPLVDALQSTNWKIFDAIERLGGDRATAAQRVRRRVADALAADEYAVPLALEVRAAQSDAVDLLAGPTPAPPSVTAPAPSRGRTRIEEDARRDLDAVAARALFETLQKRIGESHKRRLSLQWQIDEELP
jgi:hypothetical protein